MPNVTAAITSISNAMVSVMLIGVHSFGMYLAELSAAVLSLFTK